ncbi:cytochrome P450 [Mycena vulgaris]|nr:cytochrome P450 [Mycena vulgaris]
MSYDFVDSLDWRWILVLVGASSLWFHRIRKAKKPPLPPGPRRLPFVGNILDIPSRNIWLKFAQLGDIWAGDISSLTVFGQTMVIVNSLDVAEDLLDARGANFSDRPVIPMGGEMAGFNNVGALAQYGDRVRTERKFFHQLFGGHATINQFVPLLSAEIHKLLQQLVLNPDEVAGEIARTTGAITLRIAYGYQILDAPQKDPYMEMFTTSMDNFCRSTSPGAFMVDIVPARGGFHTTARGWAKQVHGTMDTAYEYVKKNMAAGTAEKSFVSSLLEEQRHDDYAIKWAAGSIQTGGSETTAAQLKAFFLAMSLYPDVQTAAQDELDAVIGTDRLAGIPDRSQLPYLDALCKEILRWHTAALTAVPHRTRQDCIYERGQNYQPLLIPKDSLVILNIWLMLHDPERYANPMAFDPTRFLVTSNEDAEIDPARICFGFGRRKLLGDTTLFLACSSILAVFNISKARENGVFVEPPLGQTTGTVRCVVDGPSLLCCS